MFEEPNMGLTRKRVVEFRTGYGERLGERKQLLNQFFVTGRHGVTGTSRIPGCHTGRFHSRGLRDHTHYHNIIVCFV